MKKLNQAHGAGILLDLSDAGELLTGEHQVDWVELLVEHMIASTKRSHQLRIDDQLLAIFRRYPVSLHGIEMSIGSTDALDSSYLRQLRELIEVAKPALVSDHLCWTRVDGLHTHELLPLPCTKEAVEHVVGRIRRVQDFLGRRVSFENPPSYVTYRHSEMSEADFMGEIAERADCGILLDVCNLRVNALNNGLDAVDYLLRLPVDRVTQIHLIGYEQYGSFFADTHARRASADVLALFRKAIARFGPVPTNIEWDQKVQSFEELCNEADRARRILRSQSSKRVA